MGLKFFEILKSPNKDLRELLHANIIGTPGHGMLYQHLGVDNKIHRIADPYFVNLVRNHKIIGTACFCSRRTANAGTNLPSFYIRYFSFKNAFRRKNIHEKSVSGKSALREEIKSVLAGKGLGKDDQEKFFHYAYVDPRNVRSLVLCNEFGFEPVRQYTSLIFNRIHPKDQVDVTLLSPSEEDNIRAVLADFYKEYTMFSFENVFNGRPYYTLKDASGKLLAGVQVNPDRWKIYSLPGRSGKVILKTFSNIPYLDRLFNTDYRFITLEGIYYAKGHERSLETLFESVLARYNLHSALICLDADSALYNVLKSLRLGWVDALTKETRGNVICKFVRVEQQEQDLFRSSPAYVSGIDVT